MGVFVGWLPFGGLECFERRVGDVTTDVLVVDLAALCTPDTGSHTRFTPPHYSSSVE